MLGWAWMEGLDFENKQDVAWPVFTSGECLRRMVQDGLDGLTAILLQLEERGLSVDPSLNPCPSV